MPAVESHYVYGFTALVPYGEWSTASDPVPTPGSPLASHRPAPPKHGLDGPWCCDRRPPPAALGPAAAPRREVASEIWEVWEVREAWGEIPLICDISRIITLGRAGAEKGRQPW